MPTAVRSHSKINLGLAVGPPRADGFHGLATMYATLELHDIITIYARRTAATRITLTADHPWVPCSAKGNAHKNTAYRMVEQALERMGVAAEVEIDLRKRLPVQGGLGAGSANAVAALLGLERELGAALRQAERLRLAEDIGSDVPLFLLGGTVLGLDRGQSVFPLPDLPSMPVVVAIPGVGVSTALAFKALDERPANEHLTPEILSANLNQLSRVLASAWMRSGVLAGTPGSDTGVLQLRAEAPKADGTATGVSFPAGVSANSGGASETAAAGGLSDQLDLDQESHPENSRETEAFSNTADKNPEAGSALDVLLQAGLVNDFEEVAFAQHPSLRALKQALSGSPKANDEPALYAALSGSGSALFGIYRTPAAARAAQARVQALGAGAVLTRTLLRSEYWQTIFV